MHIIHSQTNIQVDQASKHCNRTRTLSLANKNAPSPKLTGVAVGTLEGALRRGRDARGQIGRAGAEGRALGRADHAGHALDLERVLFCLLLLLLFVVVVCIGAEILQLPRHAEGILPEIGSDPIRFDGVPDRCDG